MEEPFAFSVTHNNKTRVFEGLFQSYGYSYRISVDIDDTTLFCERDDERNFRAILSPDAAIKQLIAILSLRLKKNWKNYSATKFYS